MARLTLRPVTVGVVILLALVQICETAIQTCLHCNQLTCDQTRNVSSSASACSLECSNDVNCQSAIYKSSKCIIYGCSTMTYASSDVTFFRRSTDTSCTNYEVYKLTNHAGAGCAVSMTTSTTSTEACLSSCLDTTGCTAVSYNRVSLTCDHHTLCATVSSSTDSDFYRRHCGYECDISRPYIQTCKNCLVDQTYVHYNSVVMVNMTSCNDTCLSDSQCVMARHYNGRCYKYSVARVRFQSALFGTNMLRMSCQDGCNVYALSKSVDKSVSCTPHSFDYAYPWENCLERCLDMTSCRAMTYDRTTMTCHYHTESSCTDLTPISYSGRDTYFRTCTEPDRTYNQTCYNCKPADTCTAYKMTFKFSENDCYAECKKDYGSCNMVQYKPENWQCDLFTCTGVQELYGNRTRRLSFSADCPDYEIHVDDNLTGNCPALEVDNGVTDFTECLQICLDKPGCRSAAFATDGTCSTFPCSSSIAAAGMQFAVRECSPWSSCNRTFTQLCHHCSPTPEWNRSASMPNTTLLSGCVISDYDYVDRGFVSAHYHRFSIPTCSYLLSIEVMFSYGSVAVRRTCVNDCPEFRLMIFYNQTTSNGVLQDTHLAIPRYEACLQLCLDETGCRCMTYNELNGECVHFSSCDTTGLINVSMGESKVHVIRECSLPATCNRIYTQTCLNCAMGSGCRAWYASDLSSVDHNCTLKDHWNDTNTLASAYGYDKESPRCGYLPCGNVVQSFSADRVYRKSCVPDCPVFELETYENATGHSSCVEMSNSGLEIIPNAGYCMDECLNLAGCVAISFDKNTGRCVSYSSCPNATHPSNGRYQRQIVLRSVFIERICTTEDLSDRPIPQTCVNCDTGDSCQFPLKQTGGQYKSYNCDSIYDCTSNRNCMTILFDTIYSYCSVIQCLEVKRKTGGIVTRMTYSTDLCREYELYKYTGSSSTGCGGSTVPGFQDYSRRAISPEDCMNNCLDINDCRGITYDVYTHECWYSVCDDYMPRTNKTFMKRVCASDFAVCNRTNMHSCINCRPDHWACQQPYNATYGLTKPRDVDTSGVGVDPDLKILWFNPRSSSLNFVECRYVFMASGHTVYRATCSNDCQKFEIFYKWRYSGVPSTVMTTLDGDLTMNYCVDKCLDLNGCRGVTYYNSSKSCDLHNATTNILYTGAGKTVFALRNCIDTATECNPSTIQTCINCMIGPECQQQYNYTRGHSLSTECLEIKEADDESEAVVFNRAASYCYRYQCSQVRFYGSSHSVVYRESCSTDCPKYELFQTLKRRSTCLIIGSEEGGVSLDYCVEKCLELDGCRAVTYNTTKYYQRCDFHDCSEFSSTVYEPTTTWVARQCVEECPKAYVQRCLNCVPSSYCQIPHLTMDSVTSAEECNATYIGVEGIDMVHYDVTTGTCEAYNCTLVQRRSFHETFRRSCNNDCPIYEIFQMNSQHGTGLVIGSENGGVDINYCINKCLDMIGCRGVTYTYIRSWTDTVNHYYQNCTYHSTNVYRPFERVSTTGYYEYRRFVQRVCLQEPGPEKPHIETCRNCGTRCEVDIPDGGTVPTTYTSSQCTPQHPDAMSSLHDVDNLCHESPCDRLTRFSVGESVSRRAINSTCSTYDLIWTKQMSPVCPSIRTYQGLSISTYSYTESYWDTILAYYENNTLLQQQIKQYISQSYLDLDYCLLKCLDTPGCLTVRLGTDSCSLYDCLDISSSGTLLTTVQKYCVDNCTAQTNKQICVNCRMGDECAEPFLEGLGKTSCGFSFGEAGLGALEYRNDVCNKYECREIQPEVGSKVWRRACNDDCPIFEIYSVNRTKGLSPVIGSSEIQMMYPYQCMERCLDTPHCRAVTFNTQKCTMHSGDCRTTTTTNPSTFIWRYCLESEAAASNQTEIAMTGQLPRVFPNSSCILPPTTTAAPTTTTTTATFTLPFISGSVNAAPIFICPCPCATSYFENMTEAEILQYFYIRMYLPRGNLSSTRRRLECATDERESAQTIGLSGAVVCLGVAGAILIMDIGTLIKALRHLFNLCKADVPKKTPKMKPNVKKQLFIRP